MLLPMLTTLDTTLTTARLRLRTITEHDLVDLYQVFSDDEVTYFLPYITWTDMLAAKSWYARVLDDAAARSALQLVLEEQASGKVIGTIILFRFDAECARAELGYALNREYWHGGYMREALQALLPHAFNELGLHRIEAEVDTRNAPSAKLLRSLGFNEEGLMRQRWKMKGEYKDTWFFGMLAGGGEQAKS